VEARLLRALDTFLPLLMVLGSASTAAAKDYLVVDLVGRSDPYHAAARRLAELRQGDVISADVNS
jgi:hypothetical protein